MCKEKITGMDFVKRICSECEPLYDFKGNTAAEFEKWRAETKLALEKFLCLPKLEKAEYNCEMKEEKSGLASPLGMLYSRQLWQIDTLKGLKMPVYVLIPENANGKAALALHCHGSDGKNGLVGIIKGDMQPNYDKLKYTYAFDMLERGYTVFCPDLLGSGERRTLKLQNVLKSDCTELNYSLISLGLNLQGIIVAELKRCVDFIEEFPDIQKGKTVCVGFSGGANSAVWLTAMDERIESTYLSGYFHSFRSTVMQSNFCGCNFIPELWNTVDMDALVLLSAPRKIFVETGKDDKLNGRDGVEGAVKLAENVKKIYKEIFDSEDFEFTVCSGAHKWYGAFIDRF